MKTTCFALLGLLLATSAPAQTTIKDALVKHWRTTADLTIAVAEAMPAADYTFRPNPEEMNYGQLMTHIAVANFNACSRAVGKTPPAFSAKVTEWTKAQNKVDIDKETAMSLLKDSFALCNQTVASMTPELLDQVHGTGERAMTTFEVLWSYFTHTAHHRGQAEVYLRMKGITPPTYKF